jgi:DNA-binding transcriptional ArsR family regulator
MITYHSNTPGGAVLTCVLKAVSDPSRRRILNLLTRQDLPVKDIASRFKISRPAVMKHLRVLRSAKLIAVQPLGRERFQCLNAAPLKQVKTWLSQYEAFWDESLRRLKRQVESES